jgi:hypothetical protein
MASLWNGCPPEALLLQVIEPVWDLLGGFIALLGGLGFYVAYSVPFIARQSGYWAAPLMMPTWSYNRLQSTRI